MGTNKHIGSDFDDFLEEKGIREEVIAGAARKLPNVRPGDILLKEFLIPLGVSRRSLARAAGVPPRLINEIVLGKRGIAADTAVRLAAVLGTSERFWLGLQVDHDLEEAHRALGGELLSLQRLTA